MASLTRTRGISVTIKNTLMTAAIYGAGALHVSEVPIQSQQRTISSPKSELSVSMWNSVLGTTAEIQRQTRQAQIAMTQTQAQQPIVMDAAKLRLVGTSFIISRFIL